MTDEPKPHDDRRQRLSPATIVERLRRLVYHTPHLRHACFGRISASTERRTPPSEGS
jgi:hypothetical protein